MRAIAVGMVVAFHAGIPVPGGFVGVDVFFVISGFVITAMLHREKVRTGRIGFPQFYLKRLIRLAPALALLVVLTMIASAIIFSPFGAQTNAAKTGIGAILFTANFVIARSTGGYFDSAAENNPLLNTWSLSVEEQFYMAFPAVIAFAWYIASQSRRLHRFPFLLFSSIAVLSFGLALAGSFDRAFKGSDLILGFYSPFTRAWEFIVGAILALTLAKVQPKKSHKFMTIIGMLGIGMLIASLWLITESTMFPGPWTLLPVAGTLLLLYAGISKNPVSSTLSARPLVRIGDWSYSIYLWHWPFIVFAVFLWPFSYLTAIIAAAVSIAPAVASYYLVEQPIRNRGVYSRKYVMKLISVVTIPPLGLAALLGLTAEYYWQPQYSSGEISPIFDGDTFVSFIDSSTVDSFYQCNLKDLSYSNCRQSKSEGPIDIAIIGDSHAEHLFAGLAGSLPEKNVASYTIAGTLPLDDDAAMSLILEQVANSPSITTVVLNAHWSGYGDFSETGLIQTLRKISGQTKKVFITDDLPGYPFEVTDCQYGNHFFDLNRCTQPIKYFENNYELYYPKLQRILSEVPHVGLLNSAKYFCNEEICDMTVGEELLYMDANHLNLQGSEYLVRALIEDNPNFKKALLTYNSIRQ